VGVSVGVWVCVEGACMWVWGGRRVSVGVWGVCVRVGVWGGCGCVCGCSFTLVHLHLMVYTFRY